MASPPQLTESQIRNWSDSGSFNRGQRYFRNNAIFNPRRQGTTLKALCHGSQPQPYRVEITLDEQGIQSGRCSCPVGGGGSCKHAVALLLTWLHEPEAFQKIEQLDESLAARSKEELIALIGKMLNRYPDLETLLEIPIPGGEKAARPLDPDVIRRQMKSIIGYGEYGYGGYEYGSDYAVAQETEQILEQGDEFAEAEDWRNAVIVYETVARTILENYETLPDDEGYVSSIADQCADRLVPVLAAVDEAALREQILQALFYIYGWDLEFGGIGVGDSAYVALLEQTTSQEKKQVAQWAQELLPTGDSFGANWRRQALGRLLLQLEEDDLDDEGYLQLCRQTGRTHDLVERLLELDRVDEAEAEARETSDYDLLRMADIFEETGHGDLAAQLIRERREGSQDLRLTQWLVDWLRERGELKEAVALANQLLEQREQMHHYRQLRDLAQEAGQLEDVLPPLLARLVEEGKFAFLTEIFLEEGRIDEALEALETLEHSDRRPGYRRVYWGPNLRLQVAAAAEEERPQAAIDIYAKEVNRLIANRGRSNYANAAQYLVRTRELYRRLDEEDVWREWILHLRQENSRLPAMQDEFDQAGLPRENKV